MGVGEVVESEGEASEGKPKLTFSATSGEGECARVLSPEVDDVDSLVCWVAAILI